MKAAERARDMAAKAAKEANDLAGFANSETDTASVSLDEATAAMNTAHQRYRDAQSRVEEKHRPRS
jgi:hypothetical protein